VFLDVLRARRSVRRFRDEPIGREILGRLVEAASWAPSASNRQDWEFVVVVSREVKAQLAAAVRERWRSLTDDGAVGEALGGYAHNFDWFADAPAVVVVTARAPEAFLSALCGERAGRVAGAATAAAMAAQNLMLAAQALGLGSCCLTGALAAEDELSHVLGLGRRREIVCLVAVGHPDEFPEAPARKPVEQIMRIVE
jgi:nitroreductase